MSDISKATPRPWRDDEDCWVCKDDTLLADCTDLQEDNWLRETQLANAALIVRAVNAHDALVEALRAIADGEGDAQVIASQTLARAGIALAEGEP